MKLSTSRPSQGKSAPSLSELVEKAETVRLSVILDQDVHTQLKVMAAQERITVSNIIRRLVSEQLKSGHGQKNPR